MFPPWSFLLANTVYKVVNCLVDWRAAVSIEESSTRDPTPSTMIIIAEDELEFPVDATIPSLLSDFSNLSRSQAAKTAIIDGPSGQVVYTHASLREAVAKLAQHLYHCGGIRPGSVVALLDTNNVRTMKMLDKQCTALIDDRRYILRSTCMLYSLAVQHLQP